MFGREPIQWLQYGRTFIFEKKKCFTWLELELTSKKDKGNTKGREKNLEQNVKMERNVNMEIDNEQPIENEESINLHDNSEGD